MSASSSNDAHRLAARLVAGGVAGTTALAILALALHRARRRRRLAALPPPDPSPRMADVLAASTAGALLAIAHPAPSRVEGALAGGGWWLAGHMRWLPAAALGPARLREEGRPSEMLLAYLAWGWACAAALRRREAIRLNRPSD